MAKAVVRGVRETAANLRAMQNAFPVAVVDAISRDSLLPLKAKVEDNARPLRQPGSAPSGGHLDQGVVIVRDRAVSRLVRVWWVSFRRRARFIAHLVEFGTAPHWQPNRFGGIMHPGARRTPFTRTAFEAESGTVIARFSAAVAAHISSTASKLRVPR